MGCKITIKKDGKYYQLSEEEYAKLISNNKETIKSGKFNEVDLDNPDAIVKQKEIKNKLLSLSNEKESIKTGEVDPLTGEIEYLYDKGIAVTKFLEQERLITPNSMDDWVKFATEQFKKEYPDLTDKEIDKMVQDKLTNFKKLGSLSIQTKQLARQFFNGNLTKEQALVKFKDLFLWVDKNESYENSDLKTIDNKAEESLESFYNQLVELKKDLINKHGEGTQFISGIKLKSETLVGDSIYAYVDLIAITPKGELNLYMFRNTMSLDMDLINMVYQKYDLEMSFIRQMLASKGFDVSSMGMYNAPIKVIGLESGTLSNSEGYIKVETSGIQDRLSKTNIHSDKLRWNYGRYFNDANDYIPVETIDDSININEAVFTNMAKMFPSSKLDWVREGTDLKTILERDVVKSENPEYAYEFYNPLTEEYIYIKDPSPVLENQEARQAVQEFMNENRQSNIQAVNEFAKNLQESIDNKNFDIASQTKFVKGSNAPYVMNNFKKYVIEHGWAVVPNTPMNNLGMVVLRNNLTNQIDIIGISYLSYMNNRIESIAPELDGRRSTILGAFKKDSEVDTRWILPATNGNIELIKILEALNQNPNLLQNGTYKIGEIKVVNPRNNPHKGNAGTIADRATLIRSYNQLMELSGIKNNLTNDMFLNEYLIFKNQLDVILNSDKITPESKDTLKSIKLTMDEKLQAYEYLESDARLEALVKLHNQMEKAYGIDSRTREEVIQSDFANTPEGGVYRTLTLMLYHASGSEFYQSKQMSKINTPGTPFDGTKIAQPEHIKDWNLKNIVTLTQEADRAAHREANEEVKRIRKEITMPFRMKKGYGMVRDKLVGDQTSIYLNLYERNSDNSLNEDILFKNPYKNSDGSLSADEVELLKKILWEINSVRYNLKETDTEKIEELKQTKNWYFVPLLKSKNRMAQEGLLGYFKTKGEDLMKMKERFAQSFKDTEDNAYVDKEITMHDLRLKNYEMYSRFDFSENSLKDRRYMLKNFSPYQWELNPETLMAAYIHDNIRRRKMNQVLPIVKATKILSLFYGQDTAVDQSNFNEFIDDYVKSVIYSKNIMNEESKRVYEFIKPVKQMVTKSMLAHNPIQPLKDLLNSTWKTLSLIKSKSYLGEEQFGFKDFSKALSFVMFDASKTPFNFTLIEAINRELALADVDMSRAYKNMVTDKSGLMNLSKNTFWTASAGDYGMRMTIFIAKAMSDGVWESLSYDDYGLTYDWTKDKRFDAYRNNDKSDIEKYNNQRSLYLALMNKFNAERNLNLSEGDALPFAYTDVDVQTIKSFSDMTMGYYDRSTKSNLSKGFFGSIFMQFMAYLSTTKNAYFLAPGREHNIREKVYKKDKDTGKQLYYQTDENGELMFDQNGQLIEGVDPSSGVKVVDWSQRYLQGIYYSLIDTISDFKKLGYKAGIKAFKNDPNRVAALKRISTNLMVFLVMGVMGVAIKDAWEEERKEKKKYTEPTITSAVNDFFFTTIARSYTKSFDDIFIWNTVKNTMSNTEPVSIGYFNKLLNTTGGVMTGDKSLMDLLYMSSAPLRGLKPVIEELNRVPEVIKEVELN